MAMTADPRDGIPAEIKRRRPDLVALGTHAKSGLARLAFGSLADHVIHTSVGVDVLAVPPEPQHGPRLTPAFEATATPVPAAG
jgi:nucleotide-binding universal stress UspA family protein